MGWIFYGRWGGPGWSDGRMTSPGDQINWDGRVRDIVDETFREHDHAYYNAEIKWNASDKTAADAAQFWKEIIIADKICIDAQLQNSIDSSLSLDARRAADDAANAFRAKMIYNYQALFSGQSVRDPYLSNIFPILRVISPLLGTNPDPLVQTIVWVYGDPMILDLDGDGLEIAPLAAGVMFDANGDGVKTGTSWAAADDGMLVWDRNGNGLIDNGGELFGDETILTHGPNAGSKASNGFTALADQDSNGDGKFDALDAQYANVRVWRDVNQDGISQATELQTLVQAGVQRINLTSEAPTSGTQYTDAQLMQEGSYTKIDSAGVSSTHQVGSFILAQDNFRTEFTPIAISSEASLLPNLRGSGRVRNLQEAATISPELIGLVQTIRQWGQVLPFAYLI